MQPWFYQLYSGGENNNGFITCILGGNIIMVLSDVFGGKLQPWFYQLYSGGEYNYGYQLYFGENTAMVLSAVFWRENNHGFISCILERK